ncbi:MAG: sulfatase family protein [Planctomycetota bacterium]|jgi:arylsulfatase A-like enzyme
MSKRTLYTWKTETICFLALACSGLFVITSYVQAKPVADAASRPNVILIYTDDQDWDEIGCYSSKIATPYIDSLARDGMRFTKFYVASSVCTPSRYNVISGRYACRSRRQQESFPPGGPINIGWEAGVIGEKLFPQVIQANGYVTGMVGKWHIGLTEELTDLPLDANPYDPQVKLVLQDNYHKVIRSIQSCGFDYVAGAFGLNHRSPKKPPPKFWLPKVLQHHNMEWVTQGALKFIEQNKDRSFFLFMAPTLTHAPQPPESLKADPRITPMGYLDKQPDIHPSRQEIMELVKRMEPKQAAATWLDANIGTVLKKLDELDLADNTAILLASDNGRYGKFTCYDGGARTFLLVRWKGIIPSGKVCRKLASNIDLAPTILDLCGIKAPPDLQLDGKSLLPVLKTGGDYRRESLFLEITTERAVVTDDGFKYIAVRYPPDIQRQVDRGRRFNHWCQPMEKNTHTMGADKQYPNYFDQDQLYDLNVDPKERKNLTGDPEHRGRLESMKKLLREYSMRLPHKFGEFTSR